MDNKISFTKFIWSLKTPYLWIVIIAIPLQLFIFKIQYPYPNFRGDSVSYINAAIVGADAAEWPVGYSKFLSLIHFISHSDTLLVIIQYLLLEISALFYLFTLKYFINPSKFAFNIQLALIILNPLFLHLGNYIMSDALFISFSLLWATHLIWIIYRPSWIQIIPHALLLLCLFTVRYNSLFYPVVALIAFVLSSLNRVVKMLGIFLSVALIVFFVEFTKSKYRELTGTTQFSPFGGWQLANNALYMYSEQGSNSDKIPVQFFELDSIVKKSFISAKNEGLVLNPYIKDYYIWSQNSPLWQYLRYKSKGDSTDLFTKWASMGPIYSAYGKYLIRKYPTAYFIHFMTPNMINFFFPAIADLGYYNQGTNRINHLVAVWFKYKNLQIDHPPRNYEISVIRPYPLLIAFFNFFFLLSVILYLLLKEYKTAIRPFNNYVIVIASFWLLNFCFSISASSVELRYQIFQFILCLCLSINLMESLKKLSYSQKKLSSAN